MHTWVRKGIALAVSGVLTVWYGSFSAVWQLSRLQPMRTSFFRQKAKILGRCNHLDGYLWTRNFRGIPAARFLLLTGETLTSEVEAPEDGNV